jgi:hypothetical protein
MFGQPILPGGFSKPDLARLELDFEVRYLIAQLPVVKIDAS